MRPLLLALALLAAGPALAADQSPPAKEATGKPVAPSEFSKYAEGHTLYFSLDGKPFGEEAFKPGGETLWRYDKDGSCMAGVWRPYGGQLCFYYGGGESSILCWRMLRDDKGLFARLLGDGPDAGMELRITGRDQRPPLCSGPGESA